MRWHTRCLSISLTTLALAGTSWAQPGPEGGGRGPFGGGMFGGGGMPFGGGGGGEGMRMMFGGGGGPPDAGAIFDFLAKGKSTLSKADLDPRMQRMWDQNNVGKESVTKAEFIETFNRGMERMRESMRDPDKFAEQRFKEGDVNNDGLLSLEELTNSGSRLKDSRDQYDTNKDGFISLDEYKAYVKGRFAGANPMMGGTTASPTGMGALPIPQQGGYSEEDAKPKVLRVGKLPPEIPSWFIELDKNGDNDGQVGLYEWRAAGKSISDFPNYDLNDDGYITPEEILKVVRGTTKPAASESSGRSMISSVNEDRGSDSRSSGGGSSRFSGSRFGGGPSSDGSGRPSRGGDRPERGSEMGSRGPGMMGMGGPGSSGGFGGRMRGPGSGDRPERPERPAPSSGSDNGERFKGPKSRPDIEDKKANKGNKGQ